MELTNWLNLYSILKWSENKNAYDFAASEFEETLKRIMETI